MLALSGFCRAGTVDTPFLVVVRVLVLVTFLSSLLPNPNYEQGQAAREVIDDRPGIITLKSAKRQVQLQDLYSYAYQVVHALAVLLIPPSHYSSQLHSKQHPYLYLHLHLHLHLHPHRRHPDDTSTWPCTSDLPGAEPSHIMIYREYLRIRVHRLRMQSQTPRTCTCEFLCTWYMLLGEHLALTLCLEYGLLNDVLCSSAERLEFHVPNSDGHV